MSHKRSISDTASIPTTKDPKRRTSFEELLDASGPMGVPSPLPEASGVSEMEPPTPFIITTLQSMESPSHPPSGLASSIVVVDAVQSPALAFSSSAGPDNCLPSLVPNSDHIKMQPSKMISPTNQESLVFGVVESGAAVTSATPVPASPTANGDSVAVPLPSTSRGLLYEKYWSIRDELVARFKTPKWIFFYNDVDIDTIVGYQTDEEALHNSSKLMKGFYICAGAERARDIYWRLRPSLTMAEFKQWTVVSHNSRKTEDLKWFASSSEARSSLRNRLVDQLSDYFVVCAGDEDCDLFSEDYPEESGTPTGEICRSYTFLEPPRFKVNFGYSDSTAINAILDTGATNVFISMDSVKALHICKLSFSASTPRVSQGMGGGLLCLEVESRVGIDELSHHQLNIRFPVLSQAHFDYAKQYDLNDRIASLIARGLRTECRMPSLIGRPLLTKYSITITPTSSGYDVRLQDHCGDLPVIRSGAMSDEKSNAGALKS